MEVATTRPVLVIGGSSFVGSQIVNQLLMKGYNVRCTFRSLADRTEMILHLFSIPEASERLEIIELDLNDNNKERWENAFKGEVEYVIHTATPSPFVPGYNSSIYSNIVEQWHQTIVSGMEKILNACQSKPSIKKLIITSSLSTICDEFDNNKSYCEDDWNTSSSLTRNAHAYCMTTAERMAWNYIQRGDCHFKLVSIIPHLVLGPHIGKKISYSHRHLLVYLTGRLRGIPNLYYGVSDVRDIANAHISAMENVKIGGRIIVSHEILPLHTILSLVTNNFPDIKIPQRQFADITVRFLFTSDSMTKREFMKYNLARKPNIESNKAKEAHLILRPLEQTIIDSVKYFIEVNAIQDETLHSPIACLIA
eukprot:gene6573-9037_t